MSYRREPRVSSDTWILVADRAKAIVFRSSWPELKTFEEVRNLVHAEGAAHPEDVLTDKPGRFAGFGNVRQSGEPQTDFQHRTAKDFAVRICELLEHGRTQNEYGRLVLVAPPLLLGVLRDHISAPLGKSIVTEIHKNLTACKPGEIREQVMDALTQTAGNNGR